MDQKKIGNFLRELRKEKNLTQEQVADKLGVSGRTISRWETGAYMPDISLIVDIAEMYDVDVRDIIDGERKDINMNSEVKEVAVKMADYSAMQTESIKKWIKTMSVSLLIVSVFLVIMEIVSELMVMRMNGLYDLRANTMRIVSGIIGPASIMAYITMALSVMGIVFATGKHRQFAHSQKAGSLVKVGVVLAILLAVIALAEVVLKVGMLYMNNPI
ncbi:MAG: helix-turn-helix transcriptional regulator [Clostridiales bacterium]|nr:helix-turn-helix transcriptional regulator [Clostridiales bacterium]